MTNQHLSHKKILIWFREDLRLSDNPALFKAIEAGGIPVPVYILDEDSENIRPYGGAKRWMLHRSLEALSKQLNALGSRLIIRKGKAGDALHSLIQETGASAVYWNRRYGKAEIALDSSLKEKIGDLVEVRSFPGHLLHEPAKVQTGQGGPYRVYTPFWKAFSSSVEVREPLPAPSSLDAPDKFPESLELADLKFLPTNPDWSVAFDERFPAGESGAQNLLDQFLEKALAGYEEKRNLPHKPGTSRLSPYLSLGVISPYQVWHAAKARTGEAPPKDLETFLKEIVWREFSYHLLYHYPDIGWDNHNEKFNAFPWADHTDKLEAWQKGMTGYPIVDAGMRELWQTGWMHNRVRMIVGSFLVKNLLIHWRRGEEWFWDTLVDADRASNSASWQWVAGSGADAAPYFRIFNPILQGEKFDPDGSYVKQYVPELKDVPARFIHKPWEAPESVLGNAGVTLGKDYPHPIVDHSKARDRALSAYEEMKEAV